MDNIIFCQKLEKYKNTVFRAAYSYCGNKSDAEDISQEVFLKFYTLDRVFQSENEEKAWLIRVTVNKCKDIFKSSWYKTKTSLEECREVYSMNESQSELIDVLMSIPEKYRIVIHLYYYEQYSVKEISEITSRKESTVQTHLQRGRKLIEKKLKEEEEYEQKLIYGNYE
ncbi:sigma-70 family RNA polymerase sigma factor [Porcipelethomonas ammoniilytica]|jgi:RNA polymerase sigma-70 factor (ECF subfamily)|uniref:RNA polymerase sigma factor n=1 Tax=Porcipelethomonas TaxID=2981643 RepID=UPI0008224727|nr:sigma-70 family RNA polymerase sigma factor [Porcipelethomonas ammoniilytica]MCU6719554.1 sigma-70 family RNA polymerase sigma factor [Porcipelethomonas ammoniilytica]SCI84808.1 RNA polymerase sigma factor sigV [uncultured Ruminococcus sp.]